MLVLLCFRRYSNRPGTSPFPSPFILRARIFRERSQAYSSNATSNAKNCPECMCGCSLEIVVDMCILDSTLLLLYLHLIHRAIKSCSYIVRSHISKPSLVARVKNICNHWLISSSTHHACDPLHDVRHTFTDRNIGILQYLINGVWVVVDK